ncbi:phage baseplate protein, partial [Achromobacter xylosoxidans]
MQLSDSLSTSTQQRVAILDADSLQVLFASAEPMRVGVREAKRATKFAVEDGTERSDHVVRELTEIQIDFLLADDTRNQF